MYWMRCLINNEGGWGTPYSLCMCACSMCACMLCSQCALIRQGVYEDVKDAWLSFKLGELATNILLLGG